MKNEVCETRAQSECRKNWECQKWKKDSVTATKSQMLMTIGADTELCNFNPFHCVRQCS